MTRIDKYYLILKNSSVLQVYKYEYFLVLYIFSSTQVTNSK